MIMMMMVILLSLSLFLAKVFDVSLKGLLFLFHTSYLTKILRTINEHYKNVE